MTALQLLSDWSSDGGTANPLLTPSARCYVSRRRELNVDRAQRRTVNQEKTRSGLNATAAVTPQNPAGRYRLTSHDTCTAEAIKKTVGVAQPHRDR